MPSEFFVMATAPMGLHLGLTLTIQSPANTSATLPVEQNMPLRWARTGAGGWGVAAAFCAADAIPEMYATERQILPGQPTGVRIIGNATAGVYPTGQYTDKFKYTGTPVAGNDVAVNADGAGGWKIVATGDGVGRVIKYSGGEMEVMF